MTKRELIELLEPFGDDIEIVIRHEQLAFDETLVYIGCEYIPARPNLSAFLVIRMKD